MKHFILLSALLLSTQASAAIGYVCNVSYLKTTMSLSAAGRFDAGKIISSQVFYVSNLGSQFGPWIPLETELNGKYYLFPSMNVALSSNDSSMLLKVYKAKAKNEKEEQVGELKVSGNETRILALGTRQENESSKRGDILRDSKYFLQLSCNEVEKIN